MSPAPGRTPVVVAAVHPPRPTPADAVNPAAQALATALVGLLAIAAAGLALLAAERAGDRRALARHRAARRYAGPLLDRTEPKET